MQTAKRIKIAATFFRNTKARHKWFKRNIRKLKTNEDLIIMTKEMLRTDKLLSVYLSLTLSFSCKRSEHYRTHSLTGIFVTVANVSVGASVKSQNYQDARRRSHTLRFMTHIFYNGPSLGQTFPLISNYSLCRFNVNFAKPDLRKVKH